MHQLDFEDVVVSRRDMFHVLLELLSPVKTRILMLEFCGFIGVDIHSVIWDIRPYIHRYNFYSIICTYVTDYIGSYGYRWEFYYFVISYITCFSPLNVSSSSFFSLLLVPAFTSFVPPTGNTWTWMLTYSPSHLSFALFSYCLFASLYISYIFLLDSFRW